MTFEENKEKLAQLLEAYLEDSDKEGELLELVTELEHDDDFKTKELFKSIFADIKKFLPQLSRKEVKQRILLIRSF